MRRSVIVENPDFTVRLDQPFKRARHDRDC